jgi:hypothetical protein
VTTTRQRISRLNAPTRAPCHRRCRRRVRRVRRARIRTRGASVISPQGPRAFRLTLHDVRCWQRDEYRYIALPLSLSPLRPVPSRRCTAWT